MNVCRCGWFVLLFNVAGLGSAEESTKLLRFPDIYKDKIVFVYAGDLWTVASDGGTATRVWFAALPQGKWGDGLGTAGRTWGAAWYRQTHW